MGGTTLQNLEYAYDHVGNVTTVTDHRDPNNPQTINYSYDLLDRLTGTTGTPDNSYDALGNLTGKAGIVYTYTVKPGDVASGHSYNRGHNRGPGRFFVVKAIPSCE